MDSILFSLRKVTRLSLLLFIIMESSLFLLKERKTQPFNANSNTQWCTMNRPMRVSWILTKNKFWLHYNFWKEATNDTKWKRKIETDENIEHMFVHKGVHFGRPNLVCPIYSSRSFNKKTINAHAVMKRISAVAPVDRLKTRLLCSARLRWCVGKFVIFFLWLTHVSSNTWMSIIDDNRLFKLLICASGGNWQIVFYRLSATDSVTKIPISRFYVWGKIEPHFLTHLKVQ